MLNIRVGMNDYTLAKRKKKKEELSLYGFNGEKKPVHVNIMFQNADFNRNLRKFNDVFLTRGYECKDRCFTRVLLKRQAMLELIR